MGRKPHPPEEAAEEAMAATRARKKRRKPHPPKEAAEEAMAATSARKKRSMPRPPEEAESTAQAAALERLRATEKALHMIAATEGTKYVSGVFQEAESAFLRALMSGSEQL